MSKLYPMEALITAVSSDSKRVYFVTADRKVKSVELKTGKSYKRKIK
ncbi:MAG: hypothetical protein Q9M89_02610 [Persephonella sp.]|nr:hypothetical protein [Persephonella sp.]